MSNPFLEPGSLLVERERQRRHRFQVGVYAALGGLLCMLMGLLIQGCQTARPKTVTPLDSTPAESTSPATTTTPAATETAPAAAPLPETNAAPAAVATPSKPAQEPSAKTNAPVSPAPPAASAVPSAPTPNAAPSAQPQSAPATQPAGAETTYVVKPGDSLSRIAKTHGTTVAAIKAANGLKSDKIVVGKKLKIPSKGTTSQQ